MEKTFCTPIVDVEFYVDIGGRCKPLISVLTTRVPETSDHVVIEQKHYKVDFKTFDYDLGKIRIFLHIVI